MLLSSLFIFSFERSNEIIMIRKKEKSVWFSPFLLFYHQLVGSVIRLESYVIDGGLVMDVVTELMFMIGKEKTNS